MTAIKSIDRISRKWAQVTPQRAQQYAEGVENPRRSWQQATLEAEDRQHAGVQAAIQNRSFAKGVERAGDAKWKRGATQKGPARWAEGVRVGQQDYAAGFAPYREAIANIQLPPRGPKGDPANYERVRIIGETLHQLKMGGVR